ncbi:hypothetical protein [Legionella beliardensis]|nr:hypothetical protein [Legionella beliardensis]
MLKINEKSDLRAKKLSLLFSFILLIAFLAIPILMNISLANKIEGLLTVSPLILAYMATLFSKRKLLDNPASNLSQQDEFSRDLLIISYSYLLATLVSLIFNYTNSDVKGCWPVIIYISWVYGLIFAFVYSLLCKLLLTNHKRYTNIFAILTFTLFAFISFYPRYLSFLYIESIETIWLLFGALTLVHFLIGSIYSFIKGSK